MPSFLKNIVKRLLVVLGVLIILLAVAVGGLRVMLSRLPVYQTDLQAWVKAELGLAVAFDEIDARWGLAGPELTLHAVRIGADATGYVFSAARAGLALDPLAFLMDRRISVHRLALDGVQLAVERTEAGEYRLAGAPRGGPDFVSLVPSQIEIVVSDSRIEYVDRGRGESWSFDDVAMSLKRESETLAIEARGVPPAALGSRIELALTAERDAQDPALTVWRLFGDLRAADLAAAARLVPTTDIYAVTGTGDVALWIDWSAGRVLRANADVELRDVRLATPASAADAAFERIALVGEWSQDANRSWTLAVSDVDLERDGRRWPAGGNTTLTLERWSGGVQHLGLSSDFLRLDDLLPIVLSFAEAPLAQQWIELDPRGELRDVDFSLQRDAEEWDYSLAVQFDELALAANAGRPGISGLTGRITTGARSGTVEFASRGVVLDWPEIFAVPIGAERLEGSLVWRQGRDVVRLVSNDLILGILDGDVSSSLELSLPLDGSSPHLDIESRWAQADLVDAKRLLPVNKMPPAVVAWLRNAVQGGVARNVEFSFFGPVAAFPFDDGEGQFRVVADVDDVQLEFIDGWPRAEDLSGTVEFVNAGFRAAGGGRILGNRSGNVNVEIPELRNAVLSYAGTTEGPLADVVAFLRSAPLIADHLGPGYDRLRVHAGIGTVDLDFALPLLDRNAFVLDGRLAIRAGDLSVEGFMPHATDIDGVLVFDGQSVGGDGIEATFLDGPVTASVFVPDDDRYRAALAVQGEATAASVLAAFNLPFGDLLAGQARWQGQLMLPAPSEAQRSPMRIDVQSNLTGVALKFPEPFEKAPSEPSNMQLGFVFPAAGGVDVDGNIGATRRFALSYGLGTERFEFKRGAIDFGGSQPQLPDEDGLVVRGNLPQIDVGDWLALGRSAATERTRSLFLGAELEIGEFAAFGQRLGTSRLEVRRDVDAWNIDIDSETIAGTVSVPRSLAQRPQIVANMQRVYLASGAAPTADPGLGNLDPRSLPGLALHATEFGIGARRFGRVDADVVPDPLGLRLASFASATESFGIEGSGSWLQGADGSITRLAMSLGSSDVAATLAELGLGAFLDGEMADITASVHWPGPPSARWMDHVGGDVAVRVETGSLVDIEPGAGRVVGLLSIAALPRRLSLDFRDVLDPGFVFDEIAGDFTIIDGNAYTDNLKLSGPGAEIGVIGRTGLRDRDYQQQAVVTAEPGNMLPTVGALVAGPTVGAAWLLFTRLFKEPLKGIGRASYCITGKWDEPQVERLTGDRLEQAEACAALPPAGFSAQREAAL